MSLSMPIARFVQRRRSGGDRQAGFTLIELLVALAILGLIAAITAPQVLKYFAKAKVDAARIELSALRNSLDLYLLDVGSYPTEQEGLRALVEKPSGAERWNGPYIRAVTVPLDPWGHAYVYRSPGQHGDYDLYSLGDGSTQVDAAGNLARR
jgi:general secretion pathway protein G